MVAARETTQSQRPLVERIRRSLERLSRERVPAKVAERGVVTGGATETLAPDELAQLRSEYQALRCRLEALKKRFPDVEAKVMESEHVLRARVLLGLDATSGAKGEGVR